MFKVPNEYRIRTIPDLASTELDGNNGAFRFEYQGYEVFCIASDGAGWDHVSVSINRKRTPSWEIMAHVKSRFWDDEDCVIQFHPPKSQHVNYHPYCLHLWRNQNQEVELPDRRMIA